MLSKYKYTYEENENILTEYLNGTHGFREICRIYGIAQQSLKEWKRLYDIFGCSGLQAESRANHYSNELKEQAVNDYISNLYL